MNDLETVIDDRYPGWRARIIADIEADQPWGDALAPALLVERGYAQWASGVYQSRDAARILEAWRRLDLAVFERYLRPAHGTTTMDQVSERNLIVITFDTAGFREHVGISGPADQWRTHRLAGLARRRRVPGHRRTTHRRAVLDRPRLTVRPVRVGIRTAAGRRPAHRERRCTTSTDTSGVRPAHGAACR